MCIDSTTPIGEAGQGDQRQRSPADLEDLAGDLLELVRGQKRLVERPHTEERHVPTHARQTDARSRHAKTGVSMAGRVQLVGPRGSVRIAELPASGGVDDEAAAARCAAR